MSYIETLIAFSGVWFYVALVVMTCIVLLLIVCFPNLLRFRKKIDTRESTKPVIGYKTAIIKGITLDNDDNIANISFTGLVGHEYSANDETKKAGVKKFNMYREPENALKHEQDWGTVFLEVVGSGNLEEYELGYTTQKQRVLQVGFIECSRFIESTKCDNEPEFLARESSDSLFNIYCARCVKKKEDRKSLSPYLNRVHHLQWDDNEATIVIMGQSSREKADFTPTTLEKVE